MRISPVRFALAAVPAVSLTAAVALPGTALAATFDHDDATHDVQRYDYGDQTVSDAPHNKSVDITRTRIIFTRHTLESTVWLRSKKVGDVWLVAGQLRTSQGKFSWLVSVAPHSKDVELDDPNGDPLPCDGITHHVASSKGRATVTVPSSCLDKPQWVREGVAFAITTADDHQLADDGLAKGGLTEDAQLKLSPKLQLPHS
jgi:hypothetical protein